MRSDPGILAAMDQMNAEIRTQLEPVLRKIRSDRASGRTDNEILGEQVNGLYGDTANWTREALSMLSASLLVRLATAEQDNKSAGGEGQANAE